MHLITKMKKECDVCYESVDCEEFMTFFPCKHMMCWTCFAKYHKLICHMCRGKVRCAARLLVKN
jgi:hypothetical protein